MRYFLLVSGFVVLAGTACRKEIPDPVADGPPTTFSQVFDEFWDQLDINYVYWDIDTTDWDAMRQQYKPLFGHLDLGNEADLQRSVGYFRGMTKGLIDQHFSIGFLNGVLMDSSVVPARDRLLASSNFREPYSYVLADERYLDSGYLFGVDNSTDPSNPLLALSGTIGGNVLFFACNQFSLSASFESGGGSAVQPVVQFFFSRLRAGQGLRALLLDFRDNPGGSVNDLGFFVGQFISKPLHFGYSRYKSGNGRLDYTPWIDASVIPQNGAGDVRVPIIILADRYSASVAEIITMALRTLPQCLVVGEVTTGATGPFGGQALYDDGPFVVPGFLSVITSSAEFKYLDGKMYEGKGFPPDYLIPFDAAALIAGDDPQMDKALKLVER